MTDSNPDSLFDLRGQVAIVTGTSRGLGQYFARALAKAGADLVLTSRDSTAPIRRAIGGYAARGRPVWFQRTGGGTSDRMRPACGSCAAASGCPG